MTAEGKIDALIARFFSAFDNRKDARPELAGIAECFTDKAIIVRHFDSGAELCTVREFADPRIALLTHGALRDFHEWEVSSKTRVYHGIAVRTSRYAKAGLLDGKDFKGSGTKCFQLVDLDIGWRIASLAWVDDDTLKR